VNAARIDWSRWTVVLCKPDAVRRNLVDAVLGRIGAEVELVARRTLVATAAQIRTHYADMIALDHWFPFDVGAELRRNYVGSTVVVALGRGDRVGTPQRVRALLGHYDPARADPASIRGRYGTDSLSRARADGRFVDNLVHTSDDPQGAEREFAIWFGPGHAHLLALPREETR
jgi:nucleoside-diphosphate kinase